MKSPSVPAGWVATFKVTGERELAWTGGYTSKPLVRGTNTVSADGRTLTSVSWEIGREAEKTTEVYDRQ